MLRQGILRPFWLFAIVLTLTVTDRSLQAETSPSNGGPVHFFQAAPDGFGDPQNSWAWSMLWWKGKLFVGTNRAFACVKEWEEQVGIGGAAGQKLFPYPPNPASGIVCTASPADLPLQAEIWTKADGVTEWNMAYQSPDDQENPDYPGKSLARDIGYRTMASFTESDGTEALYVGGVNSQPMWQGAVPSPRILRTTDGVNFSAVPQDASTFMATLPYASLDVLTSLNGSLYVVNGKMEGEGIIIGSTNPQAGDDAWAQVSPAGMNVIEMAAFNNYLYVGTYDPSLGYSVLKTDAQGPPPYTFTTVVPAGAYLSTNFGQYAWSMSVFNNQLYVGAGMLILPNPNNDDLIRINPDDTWELVEGTARSTPNGWLYPTSGLPNGFGNGFNDGIWHMQGSGGALYIGTSDESQYWSSLPGVTQALGNGFGLDAFSTPDGVYVTEITNDGFTNDLNFGIARMADTPAGIYMGVANVQTGLEIWKNSHKPSTFPGPAALQLEMKSGRPILSWDPQSQAASYAILRAPVQNFTQYATLFGEQTYTGPYEEVGTSTTTFYIDSALGSNQYLYFVRGVDAQGGLSDSSNLVFAPLQTPSEDFSGLQAKVDSLSARSHFVSSSLEGNVKKVISEAFQLVSAGHFSNGQSALDQLQKSLGSSVASPYERSLIIYVQRLMRRIQLAQSGLIDPATL